MGLGDRERQLLLDTAYGAIEFGLAQRGEMNVSLSDYPEALHDPRASFVTLRHLGELQGCVGTTRPSHPLVRDVVHNAFHAAFHDYRFPPLVREQLPGIEVHISILSPVQELRVECEDDLLRQLRPGVDGLVLEEDDLRATFLPAMWSQIPEPREFVHLLKQKAGLPRGYWSARLQAFRYTTEGIP